jgi:hypothetical protein
MPSLIRRILGMTALVTLVVAAYVAMRDWRAAAAFSVASAWGMANLVVWSAGCREILMGGPDRGTKLLRLGLIKLALLVTGLLMLRFSFPLSANQAIGVITGVPMVLVVMLLKAVGARVTGRDLMTGKTATRNSAEAAVIAGGQA